MLATQLYVGNARPMLELLQPVVNRQDFDKPRGGFWTSTWDAESEESRWVYWCRGEDYGDVDKLNWWLLTPREDIRICTIDSLKDLQHCLDEYGCPHSHAHMSLFADDRYIDFEKLAHDFDGLHLTSRGNHETHSSFPDNLNTWDCESTLWFRWCFTEVTLIEKL